MGLLAASLLQSLAPVLLHPRVPPPAEPREPRDAGHGRAAVRGRRHVPGDRRHCDLGLWVAAGDQPAVVGPERAQETGAGACVPVAGSSYLLPARVVLGGSRLGVAWAR